MGGTTRRLVCLDCIAMGDVGGDGSMNQDTLVTIPYVVEDSAVFVVEAPGGTDLFCDDSDWPDVSIPAGKRVATLEFATRDVGNAAFIAAMGGTASGTPVWRADRSESQIIKSVRAVSKAYNSSAIRIDLARCDIQGSANLKFSKVESGQIGFVCKVLLPTSGTEVPFKRTII